MSGSESEERRPLVYEDRVDYWETSTGRRRRKNICLALTILCVGVGLTLAIALPISMSSRKDSGDTPTALKSQQRNNQFPENVTYFLSSKSIHDLHTSTAYAYTTPSHSTDSSSSSEGPPFTRPTVFPPDPGTSCPNIPKNRRSTIDLEELNGKLLFELYRIQSDNSPAYVDGISCSVMELNFSRSADTTGNGSATSGVMSLHYLQRSYFSRIPKSVEVKLEGNKDQPYDFTETFGDNKQGRLSLLAQLDGFLLTYECFPNVTLYPRPGYVIHLYSFLPWRGDSEFAIALLRLTEIWGLNPAEERYTQISHRSCSR